MSHFGLVARNSEYFSLAFSTVSKHHWSTMWQYVAVTTNLTLFDIFKKYIVWTPGADSDRL